ncbi:DUF6308 family protein [Arthrobacter bambusae]
MPGRYLLTKKNWGTVELPDILTEENIEKAANLVRRYYLVPDPKTGLLGTGSQFDDWASDEALQYPHEIRDSDLVAVSLLTVTVTGKAAIGLRAARADITRLLVQIPDDVDLHNVLANRRESIIGDGAPARDLWKILVAERGAKWDIGPTTASKILARKRPRLLPIFDTVIRDVVGRDNTRDQWRNWHALLTDGAGLPERLERIHKLSTVKQPLTHLRIMDVVLWMHGKDQGFIGGRSQ